jgi:hypothetical protein
MRLSVGRISPARHFAGERLPGGAEGEAAAVGAVDGDHDVLRWSRRRSAARAPQHHLERRGPADRKQDFSDGRGGAVRHGAVDGGREKPFAGKQRVARAAEVDLADRRDRVVEEAVRLEQIVAAGDTRFRHANHRFAGIEKG